MCLLGLAGPALAAPALATPTLANSVTGAQSASATADLGSGRALSRLIGDPDTRPGHPLQKVLAHYLQQSLSRDGLPHASVEVEERAGRYYAHVAGAPPGYADRISRVVTIAELALSAQEKLRQDGKWRENEWHLFVPLGLALEHARAVQLLHFPPDASLQRQDYLASRSSRRWERLLELNGVAPSRVAQFERIVDIAPIAAPSEAGSALAQTYPYFATYARSLLADAVSPSAGQLPLPVVVQGGPARAWARKYLGARLRVATSPAYVRSGETARIPVLGANHPSLLWHVAHHSRVAALRIMRDDLVAACWQARMGEDPAQDAGEVLAACASDWDARDTEVCEQTEMQGYDVAAPQAHRNCARVARRLMRAARALRPERLARIERGAEARGPAH